MGGCHRVSAVVTSPGCPPQCPKPKGPGPREHRCLLRLLQTFPRGLPASTPPHTVHLLSIPLSKRSCGDITQIGMSLHPSPCHGFAVLWSPRLRPRPAGSSWITFQVQLWAPPFSRPGPLPGTRFPSRAPAPWLSPRCPRAGRSSRRRPIAGPVVTSPSPAVTCSGRPASATPWKGHLPTCPSVYRDCRPFLPEDRDPFLFGSRQEFSFRSLRYPGRWEQFLACPVNSDGEITYR